MVLATDTDVCPTRLGRIAAGLPFAAGVFFVSGFPALIYQVTWQRSLFAIYGVNVEAVTVVVAGFLFGLGIGSLVGGQASKRTGGSLLALFGAIETSIGLFGLFSLRIFEWAGAKTLGLPMAGTTAVLLGLLFVPTVLMGSTLPILTAHLLRRRANVGLNVGLLYSVNTLGSATACFACAFGLMRLAGMQGQVRLAAAINMLIGIAALARARQIRRLDTAAVPAAVGEATITAPIVGVGAAIALAAVTGFIALSYEILWFRTFLLANDTAAAFAIALGVYLAGIAHGSLRARHLFDRPLPARRAGLAVAGALAAGSGIGLLLLPLTAASARTGFGYFYPMLALVFAQASFLGRVFPIVCHCGITPDAAAGARLGMVYLGNILGSVAGTLVTGFVLMDRLSTAGIAVLIAELGLVLAIGLAASVVRRPPLRVAIIAGGAAIAALCAVMAPPLFGQLYEALIYKHRPAAGEEFVDTVENRNGVVTVNRDGVVYGGGAYDGRIEIDMLDDRNLLIRPFALSLFHPDPQEVLMIGLATGAWAQVIANHPALKHLTVIEINPGYLPIIRRYAAVAGLLADPKVSIVIDDGRRWLNRHPEARFDAIIQNTTWSYRPNVTNLLSAEYLRLLASHLRAGGVALYNTTGSARAQRTACEGFADGYRVLNAMVVANRPLHPDSNRLRTVLAGYRIDGRPVFNDGDPRYRAGLDAVVAELTPGVAAAKPEESAIEDCRSLLARTQGLTPITDDNMGEEWRLMPGDPLLNRLHRAMGQPVER